MNRLPVALGRWVGNVPHTRGDEPNISIYAPATVDMFPTPVGMNRP